MTDQPNQEYAGPTLVEVVDRVVVFTDQAICDPNELEALNKKNIENRIFVDVVNHLYEFTEKAIVDPQELAALKSLAKKKDGIPNPNQGSANPIPG